MIEPSVTLMTIVDVLMVGTCSFALWRLHSYRKEKFSQIAGSGFYLVVFGLVLICLFYVADFATMYALPFFIPAVNTMALMKVLHQVYMWFFIPFGVGSIVAGCIMNILKVSMLAREAQNREARFADIAEVASDWIWEMDGNLRMTYMSDRIFENFPISREDVIGKTRKEFTGFSGDEDHWLQYFDDLTSHRPFRDFQYSMTLPDGSTRHILTSGKPVFDADGVFKGYRGTGTDRTVEIEARKDLEESENQFRNLIEGSIQGVFVHKDWNFLFANHALADILGYENVEELLSLETVRSIIAPEEQDRLRGYKLAREKGGYAPEVFEARCIRKDGSLIWLEFRARLVDWHGQSAIQSVAVDITERKNAEEAFHQQKEALHIQNEHFNAALANMSQGLCMFDSKQRVIVSNERYATIYGLVPEQLKPGTTLDQIMECRIAKGIYAGENPEEFRNRWQQTLANGVKSSKVVELSDGRSIAMTHIPMPGGGWLTTQEDITDYRKIEKRLAHLAHHDALTDLPNRVLLRDQMELEIKRARRGDAFALLYLDLDGFKDVNDTFGHTIGDQLLKIVGERLRICVRKTDMVARLGGDEFAIVQTSANQPEDATALAKRICKVISAPYELGQNEVVVEMSVGITIAAKEGSDYEQLLKHADLALYRAKKDSPGSYCFFEPEMEAGVKDRHALALDLRKALAADQFELYYQPLVDLKDSKISGFEALIRWHHPERGMISPTEFIPIAEETGLINQIGEWVIHQACTEAVNWPDNIKVAVNVSPVQFRRGDILQIVNNALATSRLPASNLEIEITENVWLQDKDATLAILHQLRNLGVKIAMDDFGTGYSSLSYLQSFPFDKIKIDASFVKDVTKTDDGIGIVQAVIGIATRLGATTVAEGVETEEQLNIVRKEGCTQAQGFLFARPMPPSEISLAFLRQLTNEHLTTKWKAPIELAIAN